jgi:hypothetical protein
MRQVRLPDLHHAALAILTVEPHNRAQLCKELVWQAHVADKYVKRLRRLHPYWGDGSLRAVAMERNVEGQNPYKFNDYQSAISVVTDVIAAR